MFIRTEKSNYKLIYRNMKIKKFEAYNINYDEHDDFGEEHAKVIISKYIDGKLDGVTLRDAFLEVASDHEDEEDIQEMILSALNSFIVEMYNDSTRLDVISKMEAEKFNL